MMTVEHAASDSHRLTYGHRDRNRDCDSHLYHRLHLCEAVPRPRANLQRQEYEEDGELQGEGSNGVGSVVWGKGR